MMDITVKTKDVENVKSVIGHYDYLFSFFLIFLLLLLFHNIQFNGLDYTSLLLCAI